MTDFILSHLKHLTKNSKDELSLAHQSLAKNLQKLPPELLEQIIRALGPLESPPLQCTRLITSEQWTQALLENNLMPYLWDLDAQKVREKLATKTEYGWDMELLIRQISQIGFAEYHGGSIKLGPGQYKRRFPGSNIPQGLRNRYRIWKLVEDMKIGDVTTPSLENPQTAIEDTPSSKRPRRVRPGLFKIEYATVLCLNVFSKSCCIRAFNANIRQHCRRTNDLALQETIQLLEQCHSHL